jgi:hypothetical protein
MVSSSGRLRITASTTSNPRTASWSGRCVVMFADSVNTHQYCTPPPPLRGLNVYAAVSLQLRIPSLTPNQPRIV